MKNCNKNFNTKNLNSKSAYKSFSKLETKSIWHQIRKHIANSKKHIHQRKKMSHLKAERLFQDHVSHGAYHSPWILFTYETDDLLYKRTKKKM